ncbi:MAG: 30S ribosomal protein S6 [Candidatus Omnitrophica bacterium]|jgi:small subunit ribosomal protein S6|nr:30S ribosomal protein S6 [Candidatus Omnitrophota bacterium]
MNKYEVMVLVRPDLPEEARKTLFSHLAELIVKNEGVVSSSGVWSDRKKLYFPIKKFSEAVYYLIGFNMPPQGIVKLKQIYTLNENILRFLITRLEA